MKFVPFVSEAVKSYFNNAEARTRIDTLHDILYKGLASEQPEAEALAACVKQVALCNGLQGNSVLLPVFDIEGGFITKPGVSAFVEKPKRVTFTEAEHLPDTFAREVYTAWVALQYKKVQGLREQFADTDFSEVAKHVNGLDTAPEYVQYLKRVRDTVALALEAVALVLEDEAGAYTASDTAKCFALALAGAKPEQYPDNVRNAITAFKSASVFDMEVFPSGEKLHEYKEALQGIVTAVWQSMTDKATAEAEYKPYVFHVNTRMANMIFRASMTSAHYNRKTEGISEGREKKVANMVNSVVLAMFAELRTKADEAAKNSPKEQPKPEQPEAPKEQPKGKGKKNKVA